MPEILRHPEAEADLDDIWFYIARDDPSAADRFIDLIEERYSLLAENPLMGRSRPELVPGLRSFPVGNYLIFMYLQKTVLRLSGSLAEPGISRRFSEPQYHEQIEGC